MDIREFIIKLIDSLVWPTLVLVLSLIFKDSLRKLFKRLESLRTKYGTVNFREPLDEVKKEADQANLPQVFEGLSKHKMSYYEELARTSPRAVILEAWLQIEEAVERIIRRRPEGMPRSFGPGAQMLLELAELKKEEISIFYDLRGIRNRVVHQENARVSREQAIEYAQLALRLASKIAERFNR